MLQTAPLLCLAVNRADVCPAGPSGLDSLRFASSHLIIVDLLDCLALLLVVALHLLLLLVVVLLLLTSTSESEHQMECGLFLNIVVR